MFRLNFPLTTISISTPDIRFSLKNATGLDGKKEKKTEQKLGNETIPFKKHFRSLRQ